MDSARWDQIQTLFHDTIERPEPARQAFLETACGDDRELMAEVLAMLKAESRGASLLDRGLPDVAYQMVGAPLDSVSLREFGPYRLKSILGEGGMGVVWLAERADAGNLVAIKFLPHAGLSPARRERFAREIKTLAKLKHPFIARLYDAGTLADGTPWFVMEYVEGVRFTEYCRQQERPMEERLRLFRSVCEAVQYAHGQEIIHRDLKPSNILVEPDGTPRLLDFGIARELHTPDEPSGQTRPGLRFMSPDYAAPEWVRDGAVGFYTDVYSLGVILYEMLAGRLPSDRSALEQPGRSDLDVLCLAAMHNDTSKRYQSVEALIRDIDHYLKGEPLEARPDTLPYRLRKFVTRNRRAVLATSLAFTLLVALVIFFTLRLATARNTALAEAARTQRVERFLENLFEGGDKEAGPTEGLRVVTLLDRGVRGAQSLNGDPAVQAELYQTLGSIYDKLGKFDQADALLHSALERRKSAFGSNAKEVVESLIALGMLRVDQARLPEAEGLIREALAIGQRRLSPGDPAVARTTAALGRVLEERGQYDKAIEALNQAVRLQSAKDGVKTDLAESLTDLADAHFYLGHYAVADSLYRQVLAAHQQIYGAQHPSVASDWVDLGNIQTQWGHFTEAERYFRRALAINQSWYGKDHPETARDATYVAQALSWQGRYRESESLLEQALDAMERAYGKVHPRVALVLNQLGFAAEELGQMDQAERDFGRTVEIYRSIYGDQHPHTAIALANLATVYMRTKQYARAESLFRDALQRFIKTQSEGHLNVGVTRIKLGRTLLRQERYREAERETLAGYEILMKQTSPSVEWLQGARKDLIQEYEALSQPEKAIKFRAEQASVK